MTLTPGTTITFTDRFTGRKREGSYVRPLDAVGPDGHPRHIVAVMTRSARGGLWTRSQMVVSEARIVGSAA